MISEIIKIGLMTVGVTGGAIALKQFADTNSLYMFTLSLALYMAGTAVMAELLRGGMALGALILTASILQLVLVQIVGVFAFGEPFHAGPVLIALLAVFLLMQTGAET